MKHKTASGILLLLALVSAFAPAAGAAFVAPPSAGAPAAAAEEDPAGASEASADEGWMGAAAAILCGVFVRATIATGGSSVGTIAASVAACTFMVLEALVSPE